jgi:hypothetical protein
MVCTTNPTQKDNFKSIYKTHMLYIYNIKKKIFELPFIVKVHVFIFLRDLMKDVQQVALFQSLVSLLQQATGQPTQPNKEETIVQKMQQLHIVQEERMVLLPVGVPNK